VTGYAFISLWQQTLSNNLLPCNGISRYKEITSCSPSGSLKEYAVVTFKLAQFPVLTNPAGKTPLWCHLKNCLFLQRISPKQNNTKQRYSMGGLSISHNQGERQLEVFTLSLVIRQGLRVDTFQTLNRLTGRHPFSCRGASSRRSGSWPAAQIMVHQA